MAVAVGSKQLHMCTPCYLGKLPDAFKHLLSGVCTVFDRLSVYINKNFKEDDPLVVHLAFSQMRQNK